MWTLLSILIALGSFLGYRGTSAVVERVQSAATQPAAPVSAVRPPPAAPLPTVRPQSGSGPVGNVRT